MKIDNKSKIIKRARPPVMRPARFTPKTAYNRQKFKNKKDW